MNIKIINDNDLRELRELFIQEQNGICPILKCQVPCHDFVLDHKHKIKAEEPGKDGKGLLRGAIHFKANSFEGVVERGYKRYGLKDLISLPELLRNLADYLENPPIKEKILHPSERPKIQKEKISKKQIETMAFYYQHVFPRRKKGLKCPRSMRVNKEFRQDAAKMDGWFKKIYPNICQSFQVLHPKAKILPQLATTKTETVAFRLAFREMMAGQVIK